MLGRVFGRLGLVALGIALGLACLEGALQVTAAYIRATGAAVHISWLTKNRRILCVGDSNTYGLNVERSQAYPAVLEHLWNARAISQPIETLNLAFPGQNSSGLLKNFRAMLWATRPDVVMVMIGANDYWSVPEPVDEQVRTADRFRALLWRISRVYRLLYMVQRALRPVKFEEARWSIEEWNHGVARYGDSEFDFQWAKRQPTKEIPDMGRTLRRNLMRLVSDAGDFGIRLVFITYPAQNRWYGMASEAMRSVARETGTPLIDLGPIFQATCPRDQCPELFGDGHPTPRGYALTAKRIQEDLSLLFECTDR
jgi:lysophospholipase L1-like esterase